MALMSIKYYFLKKNHMAQKIYSKTLSDTKIMMLLDRYAKKFYK